MKNRGGKVFLKVIIERLSHIPLLWVGSGVVGWFMGVNIGPGGTILGMFSGTDIYTRHPKQPKCYWALFILGMLGIPTGMFYEYLISKQPLLNTLLYGTLVGIFFAFVVTGVDLFLSLFFRNKNVTAALPCDSPTDIPLPQNAEPNDETDQN